MLATADSTPPIARISILGSESIIVGSNISDCIARELRDVVPVSCYVILTDSNVEKLHLKRLADGIRTSCGNAQILTIVLRPGESSKSRNVKAFVEDAMLSGGCTRNSCVIALGGGVVGDLGGFVAATFMRGVAFIQVPTTLLAMVDSAIGGKTAIDTPHGKNLVGAFHQPIRIFIDLAYLRTLPKREFVNGLAEVIKTAAIWDEAEFENLENNSAEILGYVGSESESPPDSLVRAIIFSARTKAHVVTVDEKETGLRGLLNFGHSIGHAIEALATPGLLHGESISIGMVKEAELSRFLQHLDQVSVGRLIRCLQGYGLPVSLTEVNVKERAKDVVFTVASLLKVMKVDKKNQGMQKRVVLLSRIGKTLEDRASDVADEAIEKVLSPGMRPMPEASSVKPQVDIEVPGSKSISNRCLILAALGYGTCQITGLLHSDDTQVMLDSLQKLVGIRYEWEDDGKTLLIKGASGKVCSPFSELYLGNAGTAARFLTTVCTLIKSGAETTITGNHRMKLRPIGPLVDALRSNSSAISYLEREGSLPLTIGTGGLKGGIIELSASISSQYVSSILMAAPYAESEVTLKLIGGEIVSELYVEMTMKMMEQFGIIVVKKERGVYRIPQGVYKNPAQYLVEADASSATYPLAFAAINGTTVTVTNIGYESLQGDARFAKEILERMGCIVEQTPTSTTVTGPPKGTLKALGTVDMEPMTDAFLTASVLAAVAMNSANETALNEGCVSKIVGISNQRVKECNRIKAMVDELRKFGAIASELEDGIMITGSRPKTLYAPSKGVDCHDDHRVAMAFSVLASLVPGAVITDKKCVEKTWPSWWDTLENSLGMQCKGIDFTDLEEMLPPASSSQKLIATVILTGMRGAGKTHCGKAAAQALRRIFIDMDVYLENRLESKIPEIIASRGWEEFRREEVRCLNEVLDKYPTNAVIACGGGIVETSQGRKAIADFAAMVGLVVHIRRDMKTVADFLNIDQTRPMYGEDMFQTWHRRKSWYSQCSNAEFSIVKGGECDGNWDEVNRDLVRFLRFHLNASPAGLSAHTSFFLSLTFKDVDEAKDIIERISEGSSAIELRVDLLKETSDEYVIDQFFKLRRLTNLPLIYTVRTQNQGGMFPNEQIDRYFELTKLGFKVGAEYVDVEIFNEDPMTLELREALLPINRSKCSTLVIASFHDTSGEVSWVDTSLKDIVGASERSRYAVPSSMAERLLACDKVGDVVKLIGFAKTLNDNWSLQNFLYSVVPSLKIKKPIIALNMGPLGQVSRALNTFFTPVTHPLLPSSAAPGQLSVKQIHQFRQFLGLLQPKTFYLFGEPIQHSMSPALHNSGFDVVGLPHRYTIFETSNWNHVKQAVQQGLRDGSFGGASITIPLKQDIIAHGIADLITEHAKKIGAVNTLILRAGMIIGDNTDWLGIRRSILKRLEPNSSTLGIVIGAGGTSRAAVYALQSLGLTDIKIWNRTFDKAIKLAQLFGVNAIERLEDCVLSSDSDKKVIVVGTVPANAQKELNLAPLFDKAERGGIVVELAYKPRITPLIQMSQKFGGKWSYVEGIEILCEQGFEAWTLWTECPAPSKCMRESVYKGYQE